MNNATEPASVTALSASVMVKPCQRTSVVLETVPVAAVAANAIGAASEAWEKPRITPAMPRTNGPSHRNTGASCERRCRHRSASKWRDARNQPGRSEAHARGDGGDSENHAPRTRKRRIPDACRTTAPSR